MKPAFLLQIQFDQLPLCFQNPPCQPALVFHLLMEHPELSVDICGEINIDWKKRIQKIQKTLIDKQQTMQWLRELLSLQRVLLTILRFSTLATSLDILPASFPDIYVAFFAFFPITSNRAYIYEAQKRKNI